MPGSGARLLTRVPLRDDVRAGAWWLLVGAAAGGVAGLVVGGVGGRLLMLLLRVTSPPEFSGTISDDGFEIGVVSVRTLQLLATTMQIGALNGIAYAAARRFLPERVRLPLWALVGAAVGGSQIVHTDGIDFALRPQWLAVASFVALPAAGALAVAWLVERWSSVSPWPRTRRAVLGGAAVAASGVGVALALPLAAGALALGRLEPLRRLVRRRGSLGAALLLAAIAAVAAADLVHDVRIIL